MNTTDPKKKALLDSMKGGLIVSCQTQKDDPIYSEDMHIKMAQAAKWAGAVALRANSPEQIRDIKSEHRLFSRQNVVDVVLHDNVLS